MPMKYLYVLVSDDSDNYLEQALLSMTSLRMHMPNAFISILIDNTTEASLTGNRKNMLGLANEIKSVKIDRRLNKKARSRWLKTSMRQHISGDFLYIDCDTIIADDLSTLDNLNINLGAVLNEHTYLSDLAMYNPVYFGEMQAIDKKLGFVSTINSNAYFNGGLLLCKDCAIGHAFFAEWHRLWLYCYEKGNITDQQSFNQTNYTLGSVISELDGKWNCQILADGGMRYLHSAKIIHYFIALKEENPYLLASPAILKNIKETNCIDQKTKEMLADPKSLFAPHSQLRVIKKSTRKFHRSTIYYITRWIFNTKFGAVIELPLFFIRRKILKPLLQKLSK